MRIIYALCCKATGKVYVGQSKKTLQRRWEQHVRASKSPERRTLLTVALREHGAAAFERYVIATADTPEDANRLEAAFIRGLNTMAPRGYNMKPGGKENPDKGKQCPHGVYGYTNCPPCKKEAEARWEAIKWASIKARKAADPAYAARLREQRLAAEARRLAHPEKRAKYNEAHRQRRARLKADPVAAEKLARKEAADRARYREKHNAKRRAKYQRQLAQDPDFRTKKAAKLRARRARQKSEDPETLRLQEAAYRAKNAARIQAAERARWPEKYKREKARRNAKLAALPQPRMRINLFRSLL